MSESTISILWNCRPSIARPNLSNLYLLLDFLWMTHSLQSTRNSPFYNKGSFKTHQECKSEVVWLTESIQMAAGESIERAGNGNDHEGSLGKKEEWSSEAHNLECHEVLDLENFEKDILDLKIKKLERKILELKVELEGRRRGRVPQKQGGAEKVVEEVDQLVELERQRQRIEAARRKLDF